MEDKEKIKELEDKLNRRSIEGLAIKILLHEDYKKIDDKFIKRYNNKKAESLYWEELEVTINLRIGYSQGNFITIKEKVISKNIEVPTPFENSITKELTEKYCLDTLLLYLLTIEKAFKDGEFRQFKDSSLLYSPFHISGGLIHDTLLYKL